MKLSSEVLIKHSFYEVFMHRHSEAALIEISKMDSATLYQLLPRTSCNTYNYDGYHCYALPVWAIAIISAVGGFLLLVAITVFFCCRINRRRKAEKRAVEEEVRYLFMA
jgi:hypothetical protein